MSQTNWKKQVRIVITLCLITAVMGALLALVNTLTKDKIEENSQKAMNEAVASIFGPCQVSEMKLEAPLPASVSKVYTVQAEGTDVGFCVFVTPNGYGGAVEMMVGIAPDGTVAGISVVSHGETPNIGTKVVEDPAYLAQYQGMSHGVTVEDVDGISGATRSSNAVRNGVNDALSLGLGTADGAEE